MEWLSDIDLISMKIKVKFLVIVQIPNSNIINIIHISV